MSSQEERGHSQTEPAQFIEQEIRAFVRTSPANRISSMGDQVIFDGPLVQYADGDDPIFDEYKGIIAPTHLTPREALALANGKKPEDMPSRLSVISWILPISSKIRESNRRRKRKPSRLWTYTRWYGQKFNRALREYLMDLLARKGHLAVAPPMQPYYEQTLKVEGKSYFSNWSERHVAYAAGLGTFGLSDGLITERGIAHRCSSLVTDMVLPSNPRATGNPYTNCLFYTDNSCRACIDRCPAGAISKKGHDKLKCHEYLLSDRLALSEEFQQVYRGCGLCQTKVPCEASIPTKILDHKIRSD